MAALSIKLDEFCHPFMEDAPTSLVNLATGQVASMANQSYLLNTLKRGYDKMIKLQNEWDINSSRFLHPVKRACVHNFAAQNMKKKLRCLTHKKVKPNAESLRDMFVRMLVVIA